MTKIVKGSLIALLAAGLVACETQPTNQQVGAVTGGVLGGLLGAQVGQGSGRTAATILGALGGAFLGSRVGQSMDQKDRKNTAQALETAPTGSPTSWRNPDTGATYTVTPTRTYASASEPCRDFTTKALINGREEVVHGTACRQPDGTWKTR